jgi:hypothetical protein
MALADLNPRSTSKYLIAGDLTGAEGKLLTIDNLATTTAGVTVLKLAADPSEIPVAVVVVGAASDSGTYPGAATSCELYDTLIGCFDGALAGAAISNGVGVSVDGTGRFVTANPGSGDFVVGYALTDAGAAGDQFTIKFAVLTKF